MENWMCHSANAPWHQVQTKGIRGVYPAGWATALLSLNHRGMKSGERKQDSFPVKRRHVWSNCFEPQSYHIRMPFLTIVHMFFIFHRNLITNLRKFFTFAFKKVFNFLNANLRFIIKQIISQLLNNSIWPR